MAIAVRRCRFFNRTVADPVHRDLPAIPPGRHESAEGPPEPPHPRLVSWAIALFPYWISQIRTVQHRSGTWSAWMLPRWRLYYFTCFYWSSMWFEFWVYLNCVFFQSILVLPSVICTLLQKEDSLRLKFTRLTVNMFMLRNIEKLWTYLNGSERICPKMPKCTNWPFSTGLRLKLLLQNCLVWEFYFNCFLILCHDSEWFIWSIDVSCEWIKACCRYGHGLHVYYEERCKGDAGLPFFVSSNFVATLNFWVSWRLSLVFMSQFLSYKEYYDMTLR